MSTFLALNTGVPACLIWSAIGARTWVVVLFGPGKPARASAVKVPPTDWQLTGVVRMMIGTSVCV